VASQKLRWRTFVRIREAILDEGFKPGDHLGEVELAERFEVSRSPVREALLALEKEGSVATRVAACRLMSSCLLHILFFGASGSRDDAFSAGGYFGNRSAFYVHFSLVARRGEMPGLALA
jgi:hypothetical protein